MEYLNGKHGLGAQFGVRAFYTAFTVTGSLLAHYWALKTEKVNMRWALVIGARRSRPKIGRTCRPCCWP